MPGKIELHYSPNLSFLTENFLKKKVIPVDHSATTLYLVHHSNRVHALRKKYFLTGSGKISFDFPFMTYSKFFQRLLNQNNVQKLKLTFPKRCLFLSEIIKKNAGNLTYFQYTNQSFPADVLKAILTYFDEIRLSESDSLMLDLSAGRLALSSSDKLQHDLKTIFSKYLSEMTTDYLDEAEFIKQNLLHSSKKFWNTYYSNLKWLVFENVSPFKSLHLKFIKHLKSLGFDIYLLLPYGRNSEIFAHKKSLFNRLREVSDHLQIYHEPANISKSLFQIKPARINVHDKISILPAGKRLQEVENLAAEIKKNVVDHGWRYSQIGVSSPQLNHYRSLLEAVLSRYNIPYDLRENKALRWALPIKHLEHLLKIVSENYPVKSLQRILQSSFYSYHKKLQDSGFIKILTGLRFRHGKSEVLNVLENERKFYHRKLTEENQTLEGKESYQKLIKALKELMLEAKFFEKPQFANSIYQHLVSIIKRHRFLEQIYREAEGHHEDLALENFEALHTFISGLFTWVEMSSKISPRKKYSVSEFLEIFSLLTETESYSSSPPRHYGVQIFPLANLSGQEFSALYILGMEDGVFPNVLSFKFTHPQYLPEQLASYLPTDPLLHQREMFLEMLQFPAQLIQFSYPCYYKDNPILPSIFLRELKRISSNNLEKSPKIRLFTPSDILGSLGLEKSFDKNVSYNEGKVPVEFRIFVSSKMLRFFHHRLKVTQLRETKVGDSIWKGNLFQDKLSASWLDISLKNKRFSPTQLEIFAKCPMLYFLQRLLLVQHLEEGQEYLSP
jgi:ATP-dependent helicase/DNAse subunit B